MKLRTAFQPREALYPSNLLTLARLLLIPPTILFLFRREGRRQALACMALAMLTDAADGPIARMRGEVSDLGKILDPLADKLVIDTTAFALSMTRSFPWWVTSLMIFRDVGILLSARTLYRRRAHIISAQPVGKMTTLAMTGAMLLYIADGPRSGRPALWVALVPFMLSFWQYGRVFLRIMRKE